MNVTRLRKARLKDVFSAEPCEGVDITLIQESRHDSLSSGWVVKLTEGTWFWCGVFEGPDEGQRGQSAARWNHGVL